MLTGGTAFKMSSIAPTIRAWAARAGSLRAGCSKKRSAVRMHAVAVVLDLVQPVRALGRLVYQARELRLDPCWRMGRLGDRCCGLDLSPRYAGSSINRRALWHRGYQGKGATRARASTPP